MNSDKQHGNRLFFVFGILGSLLVELGIILILAHNWQVLVGETTAPEAETTQAH